MDAQLNSIALPTISTLLSGAVLMYVKWTREDVQTVVKNLNEVKETVSVNGGRISHLEQMTTYHQQATDQRLGSVTGRVSDLSGDVDRLAATIAVCPNCPHPGGQGGARP